jgi:hypothetical protein
MFGAAFGISRATQITVWLAIALLFVCTHSCAAWLGWSAKGNQVAAQQLPRVEAQLEADRSEYVTRGQIDAEIITGTARQAVAADAEFRQIREEVPHAARPVVRAEPAVPADCPRCNCEFDARFIRVWNRALEATVPGAAGGAAAAAAGPGAAAALTPGPSPRGRGEEVVAAEEILRNHVDNAEIHADNRRQCEGLLAWHRKHQERTQ